MDRETLPEGSLRLHQGGCTFVYTRLRPGALLVRIRGYDRGELGHAPFEPLDAEIATHPPLDLFVDTCEAEGASTQVSTAWTAWFQSRRPKLREVHILVTSKFLDLTVNVAKHFSRTGQLIRVHSDGSHFEAAVLRLVPGLKKLPAPPRPPFS